MKPRISVPVILLVACAAAPAWAQEWFPEENPRITLDIPDQPVFHRADRVPVTFQPEEDGYVTIFRIDTDGRLRVLYPAGPADDNFVAGGVEYRVPNPYGYAVDHTFAIDDYPGIGYLFAVLSRSPYEYQPYVLNEHWDYRTVGSAGRITGDPYVAVSELLERMLPPDATDYGFDVLPYYVEARYEYPRFVCYDCHAYVAYPVWDPYRYWCATFQVVIYDYPVWYPGTLYPPTQVVVVAGGATVQPQYLIRARTQTDPQVVHVTRRGTPQRADPGVRGRDIGGTGSVPAPREQSARGGIGSVLRRLLGASDAGTNRRPIAPGAVAPTPTTTEKRPQLERRVKQRKPDGEAGPPMNAATEGRRPGSGGSRIPAAQPSPAVTPSTPGQRPSPAPNAKRTAGRPSRESAKPSASPRRPGWQR